MSLKFTHSPSKRLRLFTGLFVSTVVWASASVWAATAEKSTTRLGNDDEAFVFSGKCANDEPYRLVAYQKNASGFAKSFYDYEGPNGKGTVQTETTPKVMAARVCRRMAEIINVNYWE